MNTVRIGVAIAAAVAVLTTSFFLCAQQASSENARTQPVEIEIRNVNFRIDQSIVLEIRRLRGEMVPTSASEPASFDDKNSFVTRIVSAEIAISTQSMSDLLNRYAFAYPDAPLKNLVLTAEKGRIRQKGTIHKGVDLPFEATGSLDTTTEGQVRFHVDKIRSAHLPVKGLLHLFGEDLSRLVNLKKDRGITIDGDDILMDVNRLIPPPRIEGKVTSVRVEGNRIVQTFGSWPAKPLSPPYRARNYIYHHGGVLRFGKLTMTDSDLEIVDQSPRTPFEFSLAEYNRQLVAGYSKNTPSHGLIVFMPDLSSLGRR
jgi:hypothetical protein